MFSEKATRSWVVGDTEGGSDMEQMGRNLDGITDSPRVGLRLGQGQGPVHHIA